MLGKHRLGIYEKAFAPVTDWARSLSRARELGFDFLEISVDESDGRLSRLYWTPEQRRALKKAIMDEGLPISSMCLSAHRRFPLGSADAAVERKAMEIMERAVDFAAELGIRIIQLAAYDVYYEPSTERTVARYGENLEKAAHIAEKSSVMLANEIMDTAFMNSITKHLAYEKSINSPWLKVYPELGNLSAWGNDVCAELKKGMGSIVQVHLKDTLPVTADFPGQFRDLPFGEGCVNFEKCFSCLENEGYSGAYLIEMWHRPDGDELSDIIAAKNYLTDIFARTVGEGEA